MSRHLLTAPTWTMDNCTPWTELRESVVAIDKFYTKALVQPFGIMMWIVNAVTEIMQEMKEWLRVSTVPVPCARVALCLGEKHPKTSS